MWCSGLFFRYGDKEIENIGEDGMKQKSKLNVNQGIKIPHTLVIIFAIILFVSVATYFVPGGAYERVVNEAGKTVVVDGSFEYTQSEPQGLFNVFQSPITGIVEGAEIIAFILVVSGAFNIITRTKAIDSGIARIVHMFRGKEILVIPAVMFLFSLGGAVFGMTEETIPFIAMLIPLTLALGYDSIVAIGISYLGCIIGFATAMLNPFTVGIAQSIAGVPVYSGIVFRTIVWVVFTIVGILFMMRYASKIKKNPTLSPVYEIDQKKRAKLAEKEGESTEFTGAQKIVLAILGVSMGIIIWGVLAKGFWIPEIAAVFLGAGVLCGIIGRLSLDEMAESFIEGAKDMIGAALMVGFARGIVIIAENAHIIDTVLYSLSSVIGKLPAVIAGYFMLFVQTFINFFVCSGSGQAALTMPIIAPLGDLIGITSQTSVLIFQFGDGFSNAMIPTSATLMACLAMAGIPFTKWFKWVIKLQLLLYGLAMVVITFAIMMQWS